MQHVVRAALAAVILAVVPAAIAQDKVNLSIVTGPTSGVYYPLGGGMAAILSKVPGFSANAEATAGSVANLRLMGSGKADFGLTMADATWDAFQGNDKFKDNKVNVRALMVLYPNRMHVVTVEGTGINRMSDLKGKRVSTGAPESATEVMAQRLLEASGLSLSDVRRERLTPGESANAIKDRKLDAFFWVGGIPTSAVTDLGATPGMKLKLVDHGDAIDAMNKKFGPLYVRDRIPAKSYPGQDQDNAIASVWNVLVTTDKMKDEVAYQIVKTFFDRRDDLIAVHKEAQNFDLKYQTNNASPVPFHPGAIKYFAERGLKLK
jgi:TRAP transporter TAXI family solute receptor